MTGLLNEAPRWQIVGDRWQSANITERERLFINFLQSVGKYNNVIFMWYIIVKMNTYLIIITMYRNIMNINNPI